MGFGCGGGTTYKLLIIISIYKFQRKIMGFGCGGGTTCKAALKKFEETTGSRAAECPEIRLIGVGFICR